MSNELVMLNSLNISDSSSSEGSGINLEPNKFLSGLSEYSGATLLCSTVVSVLEAQPLILGVAGKNAVTIPAQDAAQATRKIDCLILGSFSILAVISV